MGPDAAADDRFLPKKENIIMNENRPKGDLPVILMHLVSSLALPALALAFLLTRFLFLSIKYQIVNDGNLPPYLVKVPKPISQSLVSILKDDCP